MMKVTDIKDTSNRVGDGCGARIITASCQSTKYGPVSTYLLYYTGPGTYCVVNSGDLPAILDHAEAVGVTELAIGSGFLPDGSTDNGRFSINELRTDPGKHGLLSVDFPERY
jgi:hypothetical protein